MCLGYLGRYAPVRVPEDCHFCCVDDELSAMDPLLLGTWENLPSAGLMEMEWTQSFSDPVSLTCFAFQNATVVEGGRQKKTPPNQQIRKNVRFFLMNTSVGKSLAPILRLSICAGVASSSFCASSKLPSDHWQPAAIK